MEIAQNYQYTLELLEVQLCEENFNFTTPGNKIHFNFAFLFLFD